METIRGKTETGNKAITKLKQEDKGTNANIKVQIYSLSGHGRFISAHTLTTFSWLIIKDQENLLFFPCLWLNQLITCPSIRINNLTSQRGYCTVVIHPCFLCLHGCCVFIPPCLTSFLHVSIPIKPKLINYLFNWEGKKRGGNWERESFSSQELLTSFLPGNLMELNAIKFNIRQFNPAVYQSLLFSSPFPTLPLPFLSPFIRSCCF